MEYTLRRYRDGDEHALSALCREAITQIGPRAYSEEQIAAWVARHPGPERYRERVASGAIIFVVADDIGTPVAYSLLDPDGHLDHLYAHPQHTRRGLAEQALEAAENHALELGITRLYTEASELARPAFERAGYSVTHRRDFTIPYDGREIAIHNYAMEKALNGLRS
ncbi:GNAT family N-acetyltransferase [Erythrobacter sp. W53]|uniref:GNAT family N-acetyltransferase n=1 Tax=Erythrobacter sp. W53 TaxID=3425947 RepID=UPI003D76992F